MVRIRTDLATFAPYVPGKQPEDGNWIKLNTNEASECPPGALAALNALGPEGLFRYPDPTAMPLRRDLAGHYGLTPDRVVVGNGSDEILSLLLRAVCDPGAEVLAPDPAYSLYPVLAAAQGASYRAIACLDDFALDLESVCAARPAITFITSPNNPAGTSYPARQIARICASGHNLVVVDEAYAEFADSNALGLLREFPNLAIARTFSKAYGLAGARVGYLLGPAELCQTLLALKDAYNVSAAAQAAAQAALRDRDWAEAMWESVRNRRSRLIAGLSSIPGLEPHPSQANFVLVDCGPHSAPRLLEQLAARKILVRHLGHVRGAENALRITVGKDSEIEQLLGELSAICHAC
ncbi:MAG: histidinol-phosphate transaminase [Chloroflexota bacterium]|nr:histidinol-phosphate transaminase [Chloroflexota bacterium]